MQEDVENRSLTLMINSGKLTARTLVTAFAKFLRCMFLPGQLPGITKRIVLTREDTIKEECRMYLQLYFNPDRLSDDGKASNFGIMEMTKGGIIMLKNFEQMKMELSLYQGLQLPPLAVCFS